jgi:transposase
MFIHCKKNKSGTTSVQILESVRIPGQKNPKSMVMMTFGSGGTLEEVEYLKGRARAYLDGLEREGSPRDSRASFAKHTPNGEKTFEVPGGVLLQYGENISSCTSHIKGFNDVFGLLYDRIFTKTGLQSKGNRMMKDLAIMRIAHPKSKNFTAQIAKEYEIDFSVDQIYKLMDRIDEGVISQIKASSLKNTKRLLAGEGEELEVIFYDLTTLYFEVGTRDELRDFGFSKDGKHQHVQIMMAIITTKNGLPLGYEIFPGNTYEGHTLIPSLEKLMSKYKIKKVVVVADSGLISRENIQGIEALGLGYILGGRVKSGSADLKKAVLEETGYTELTPELQGKIFQPLTKAQKQAAKEALELAKKARRNTDADQSQSPLAQGLSSLCSTPPKTDPQNPPTDDTSAEKDLNPIYIYHCQTRHKKEAYEREKAVAKVMENIGKPLKSKLFGIYKSSFVKIGNDQNIIGIDEEKLQKAAQLDGFFTLETNMKGASLMDTLNNYRNLWQIEQTFRLLKYNIALRPIFHYNTNRIKAHFALCYIALVLIRTIEFQTMKSGCYIPLERLITNLKQVKTVIILVKNQTLKIAQDFPKSLIPLYKSLKIPLPQRLSIT